MNKILKIKDIMSANVASFSVDTLVDEIISTMQKKKISSVIIVDGKKPLGIITERDILKASLSPEKTLHMKVTQLMSSPVKTMPSYADYRDAYMEMNEQKIRHIVVTNNEGEVVGILSESNFLNHLSPEQLLAIKEVSKVMTKSVCTCKPHETLRSVLGQMVDKKIGAIVVEQNNKAVGIISERDSLKFIQESKEFLDQAVSMCMSAPVSTIHERQTVLNAQSMMDNLGIRRLVVVDDNEAIAGVVSRHDLIKHIPEYYVEILREMIERQKSLVSSTQVELDEKIIFQNALKSLPHTLVLMTQKEGIIQFVNINEKAFCSIPTIKVGDNLDNQESSFFELLQNDTWKDKVAHGETVHKIIKIKNKNFDSCYLHTSISAIFDEKNRFNGYLYIARNISLEHSLELELQRLTDHLKEAYHIANIGNWELDAETLNGYWSDEICDIVGMPRNSKGGPDVLKTLVKEEDFEIIENSLLSALQTGSSHELIYEVFPKNSDKSHWVECRARRELNADGTPKCLIGTLQDITQRVETQKKARENEDSMLLALESAGHGVWDFNAKDNTQNLSPQYKSMLGYDNDEMENTLEAFLYILHPDDLSRVQSTIKSFISTKHHKGDKFSQVFRMKAKDGTYKWILSNGNVVSADDDGNILRIIGTHTDISEQKKIEEELHLFKRGIEASNEGITITKAGNDEEIIYVNPAFEKLTGYSSNEMLGKNLRLLNEKNREQPEIELIRNAIENNESIEVSLKNYRKDGSEFISQLSIDPIFDEANTVTHFVGIQKDITEQKEIEKALTQEKARYEKAEKIAHLGAWERNILDDTIHWSDEVYKIFEIDISKNMTFYDFIERVHPEDRENVIETFRTSAEEHKTYHLINRLLFSDGRIKYVLDDAEHVYDSSDNHIYTSGAIQDITKQQEAEIALQKSHSLLRKLSDTIPAAIYQYQLFLDGRSCFPYASIGIEDVYEVAPKTVINDAQSVFNRIHTDDFKMVVDSITTSAQTMQIWSLEYRVELPIKGLRWLKGTAQPEKLEDDSILWHGYIHDITKEKNILNALKEKELLLKQSATVFENTTEGVMITDANSIILNVNKAFYQITGREREEVLGKKASILKSGRHNKKFYNEMWKSISKFGFWRGEIWNRRKDGEIYPQWLNISSVKNSSGVVESYIAVFSDITSLKETEAELDFLAHHDHLTELPNRVLLNARLKHTLSTAKRDQSMTAVMFMDIDNFKNINDSYGHTFGDELLIAVSHRLKIIMREDDTLSRIGGDEFVIVMSHFTTLEQITHSAQKIMDQFEEAFVIEDKEFWISISLGIAIAPDDGVSTEILIKNADTAMYEAKGDGKNTVKFYNDKMSASSFERIVFESALKNAILNKEFEVYYQPQEDLQDNSIIGFEALVRWNHPTLGLVPPDRFISIAEETKMILDIGEFVLEQSCKDVKKWHEEGLCKGRVAVNVSGVQLEYSDFAEILNHNLKKYNVDPSMIEIEVTESMVMKNPQRWINILEEIHRIGVSISMDDFGTGYSSLSYLRRFPVDTLKIDQSFVQDIPKEKDACAIVDAIIHMAHSLGFNTLAEGIETSAQREYLVKKSCNHGQGYLLSKPMNGEDTYSWLKEKHLKK